jgi:hypothetical protein
MSKTCLQVETELLFEEVNGDRGWTFQGEGTRKSS